MLHVFVVDARSLGVFGGQESGHGHIEEFRHVLPSFCQILQCNLTNIENEISQICIFCFNLFDKFVIMKII